MKFTGKYFVLRHCCPCLVGPPMQRQWPPVTDDVEQVLAGMRRAYEDKDAPGHGSEHELGPMLGEDGGGCGWMEEVFVSVN